MAATSSDTAFLTSVKSFSYRGAREEWANVYHFDQVPPSTSAWESLYQAVYLKEVPMFPADVQFERATGHAPGTPPILVWEVDNPPVGEGGPAGTFTPVATEHEAPGDAAAWVRYGTTQRNSLGKPIYLRNYYHGLYTETDGDTFSARQKTAFDAMGAQMVTGFSVLGTTYRRAGPRGAVAQNHAVSAFVTTRTLKSRGRRHRITQQELIDAVKAAKASDVPFILGPAIG